MRSDRTDHDDRSVEPPSRQPPTVASAQLPWAAPEPALHRVAATLALRFAGTFSPETVDRFVLDSYHRLAAHAHVGTHLLVLAERFAADRLTAFAWAEGRIPKLVTEVLFVCTRNAGRSQMAAALLRYRTGGQVHARTAGTTPADRVDPVVSAVLASRGLDIAEEFPKPLTEEVVRVADVVVTMGCGDACPLYPGKRYLDWDLPDPDGADPAQVRAILDRLDIHIADLLTQITGGVAIAPLYTR